MGLLQIAKRGQLCHFVADGGGGILHIGQLRNGLGAHGLSGTDIQVYDAAQNFFLALGQFHKPSSFS